MTLSVCCVSLKALTGWSICFDTGLCFMYLVLEPLARSDLLPFYMQNFILKEMTKGKGQKLKMMWDLI